MKKGRILKRIAIASLACTLILFLGEIFGAVELIQSLIMPSILSEHRTLLDDYNKDLESRVIGAGDIVEFKFPSESKSVDGRYAVSGVAFIPHDESLPPWDGNEKPVDWGDKITGDMKDFDIFLEIPVPEDPRLEGNTIIGTIEMTLTYPVETRSSAGIIPGKFEDRSEDLEKPISIHVFTPDQIEHVTELGDSLNSISTPYRLFGLFAFFSFVGALFILLSSRSRKAKS